MMAASESDFDPYHIWLSIPKDRQPPDYYTLIGVAIFEADPLVIEHAADRQMAHVRTLQFGGHATVSQRILNEISQAKICLLDADARTEYNRLIQREQEAARVKEDTKNRPIPRQPLPRGVIQIARPIQVEPKESTTDRETYTINVTPSKHRHRESTKVSTKHAIIAGVIALVVVLVFRASPAGWAVAVVSGVWGHIVGWRLGINAYYKVTMPDEEQSTAPRVLGYAGSLAAILAFYVIGMSIVEIVMSALEATRV